jgi:outer membrane biosynthesis protein TonB
METPAARRRPIGMILVEAGAITVEDLVSALAEQRRTRRRLGEILIDSGLITWMQLAEAIAEQARDLDPTAPPAEPEQEPDLVPEPQPEPQPEPEPEPVPAAEAPTVVSPTIPRVPTVTADTAAGDRPDLELMLMERQRAFLELVSVTETLRSTVTRLQDELAQRDAEISRLRSMALPAAG